MSRTPQLYLVTYDIHDPKRLRRVYKIMRGFGDGIQYSVFRCVLSGVQHARLMDRLSDAIDHRKDQVLIVRLGAADSPKSWTMDTLGLPLPPGERQVHIL